MENNKHNPILGLPVRPKVKKSTEVRKTSLGFNHHFHPFPNRHPFPLKPPSSWDTSSKHDLIEAIAPITCGLTAVAGLLAEGSEVNERGGDFKFFFFLIVFEVLFLEKT